MIYLEKGYKYEERNDCMTTKNAKIIMHNVESMKGICLIVNVWLRKQKIWTRIYIFPVFPEGELCTQTQNFLW